MILLKSYACKKSDSQVKCKNALGRIAGLQDF